MTEPSLTARRQAVIDHAHKIGISDDYIDLLVESFYQRIREHPILGPVFNDAIGDNWPHHLAQMKNFWASVTLNSGRYSGQPVPAHKKHLGSIQRPKTISWSAPNGLPKACNSPYLACRALRSSKGLIEQEILDF